MIINHFLNYIYAAMCVSIYMYSRSGVLLLLLIMSTLFLKCFTLPRGVWLWHKRVIINSLIHINTSACTPIATPDDRLGFIYSRNRWHWKLLRIIMTIIHNTWYYSSTSSSTCCWLTRFMFFNSKGCILVVILLLLVLIVVVMEILSSVHHIEMWVMTSTAELSRVLLIK